jgi:hypothetical protein
VPHGRDATVVARTARVADGRIHVDLLTRHVEIRPSERFVSESCISR